MGEGNGVQKIKPGDQVWYAARQEELIVGVVDDEAGVLAPCGIVEQWIGIGEVALQKSCEIEKSVAVIKAFAAESGRRAVVARRALARLWSDGTLAEIAKKGIGS